MTAAVNPELYAKTGSIPDLQEPSRSTSIASVTVCWNGSAILPGLLESQLKQTTPLSELIVVDNASTDGTINLLNEQYPSVKIIRLATNEGVSGGYSAGLEYALGRNYDWVWMLDQDSRPLPSTVEKLLAAAESFPDRDKLGLIAPLAIDAATGVPYSLFLWREGQVALSAMPGGNTLTLVDMVISSGSLIRGEAVRKAGLPRNDFFIDFVDYEHCLRLRRNGFLIAVVNQCIMPHTIGQPRSVKFLGKQMSWITHRPWRDYYKVRNRAFVVWHQVPSLRAKAFVMRQFLTQMIGSLLFDPEKVRRINFMLRGLRDGIRGRLGITVRPTD
jgi:rhamnopyranosyl-N-acetylglucosaminyl-diphospho-decaprenol beta-1,3/1,4-galactofuranosyltransferase